MNKVTVNDHKTLEPLSPDQEQALWAATQEILAAHVTGRAIHLPDPTLGGLADRIVHGVFVSLKRSGQLRSCCGIMGSEVTLLDALLQAGERTALEDPRFPPVAACELPFLDGQIWILGPFVPMTATGRSRIDAVTIGRHGLRIAVGDRAGLLLPGVATDNGYDPEGFLRQVSLKAGLEPEGWMRIDARLWTFEGLEIAGPAWPANAPPPRGERTPGLSTVDVEDYARFALAGLSARLSGTRSGSSLGTRPRRSVAGVLVNLTGSGRPESPLGQIVLNKMMDLHETLETLLDQMAAGLKRSGMTAATLDGMRLELTIVDDTAVSGTVDSPDLDAIDRDDRAVMVLSGNQFAFLHDPGCGGRARLERALQIGGLHHALGAALYSFRSVSNATSSQMSRVLAGSAGVPQRPTAVAGAFYPADPAELESTTRGLLGDDPPAEEPRSYPAAMVPHAALRFSGQIAADTLRRVRIPDRVLILCPHHTGKGVPLAIAPHETWGLPGGPVSSDRSMAESLAQAIPGFKLDAAAHAGEHAIEVQLPLLRALAPDARVVGITVGHQPVASLRNYGRYLAEWLEEQDDPPLLLISSDMNHFERDDRNRVLDAKALEAMETLDPTHLHETVTRQNISMCGIGPAVIILQALKERGQLNRMIRTGYGTSADAGADASRVVGYAGALFD